MRGGEQAADSEGEMGLLLTVRHKYLRERGVRGGEQAADSEGEMGLLLTVRLRARGELAVITFSTVFGWS